MAVSAVVTTVTCVADRPPAFDRRWYLRAKPRNCGRDLRRWRGVQAFFRQPADIVDTSNACMACSSVDWHAGRASVGRNVQNNTGCSGSGGGSGGVKKGTKHDGDDGQQRFSWHIGWAVLVSDCYVKFRCLQLHTGCTCLQVATQLCHFHISIQLHGKHNISS